MDINSVSLIGRLTRDSEIKYTSQGSAVMEFSIAVGHMKKEDTSFFNCKAFGKLAENLKPYLQKGKQIGVNGYLKQDRWESEGQKRERVVIHCEDIELLGGNKTESNNYTEQAYY